MSEQVKQRNDLAEQGNDNDANTALVPAAPEDDGWNSPPDDPEAERMLPGVLLRFIDGVWVCGKEKEPVALGTTFIATAIRAGWQFWEGGKPTNFVSVIDGHYPRREELGYLDKDAWELGPGGPSDPWQNSRHLSLVDPVSLEEFTFVTTTAGGRSEVDALWQQVLRARWTRPGALPVIRLESKKMKTRYGEKPKPGLKVVGWRFPGEAPPKTPELPKGSDMNDEIPF
jgi:hypothetical protein